MRWRWRWTRRRRTPRAGSSSRPTSRFSPIPPWGGSARSRSKTSPGFRADRGSPRRHENAMKHGKGAILHAEQERYIERLLPPRDAVLREIEEYAEREDVPISDPE